MDKEFVSKFDLKPLLLSDRNQLQGFCSQLSQPLAEHSFASWFVWGTPINMHWMVHKEYLCLFVNCSNEVTLFVPPLKSPAANAGDFEEVIHKVFEIMDAWNIERNGRAMSTIDYVSDQYKDNFQFMLGSFDLVQMGTDYVYDMQKMIELPGSALKAKRHAKTKFMRDYPDYMVANYDREKHKADCSDLLKRWADHRKNHDKDACNLSNVSLSGLVNRDFDAVMLTLDHCQDLALSGMVLYVGQQLAGFTFGEALNESQASIMIEKTDPDFPGCPQFLFSEFCRCVWKNYNECNAGDDWGIPNLTFTKMSYRPIKLLPKYAFRHKPA